MTIKLICLGKTNENWLRQGIETYIGRLGHYIRFEYQELVLPGKWASLPAEQLKQKEWEAVESQLTGSDHLILLDEKGKQMRSVEFASFLSRQMIQSSRRMVFVIGGAWGFSKEAYARSSMQMSLSAMTFSHQMARLFFTEQLYRAMTIIRNECYHNE